MHVRKHNWDCRSLSFGTSLSLSSVTALFWWLSHAGFLSQDKCITCSLHAVLPGKKIKRGHDFKSDNDLIARHSESKEELMITSFISDNEALVKRIIVTHDIILP